MELTGEVGLGGGAEHEKMTIDFLLRSLSRVLPS